MGYISSASIGGTSYKIASSLYGTCATADDTAEKAVTCTDFTDLITGVTIHVKFTYANGVASPTLNVNSKGAKNIYRYGTTAPSTTAATSWNAGAVVSFTYDGSAWIMNDWVNSTTDTKNTAGSSNTSSKIFLIGATSQATSPKTYSHDTAYVGTDGCLYSNSTKVITTADVGKLLKLSSVSISAATSSGTIATVNNSDITATMEVINCIIADPLNQTSDWTATTTAGKLTITGTCSAATTATIYLAEV